MKKINSDEEDITGSPQKIDDSKDETGIPKKRNDLLIFLNSGLGLLLLGSLLGGIGLFTWQRQDWVFKQEYLREQIILDRKIDLIEEINADIGALVADADGVSVGVSKRVPGNQMNNLIEIYNEEQARWFGVSAAHQALIGFYFPQDVVDEFSNGVIEATKKLDVSIYTCTQERSQESFRNAYAASQNVRNTLQEWNNLALTNLQVKR